MRKQNVPHVNDTQMLDAIVAAKQGTRKLRLGNIQAKINGAYTRFIANSSCLGVMTPIKLNKAQRQDMEHCYNSNTAGLTSLKTFIKGSHSTLDRELCPYCGIREPSEFDHYLPKSKFQEFSVFSKNLIWICHRCNHKKKEHFSSNNRYLNTYFDAIPEEQFLFCTIGIPFEEHGASFYLQKPNSITVRQYSDIVSHATNLKLLETYEQMASQKLPTWFKKWRILADSYDKEGLKTHLFNDMQAEIRVDTDKFGQNHYKRVLKMGIISMLDEIVEHLYN